MKKLAIVGATGLVGRTILQVLEEESLSDFEYTLFASSKSAGKHIHFMGRDYEVQCLCSTSFDEHFDYAIFSAGASTAKEFAPIAADRGCIVIDNSSAFRMEKDVPLIVPEVNPEQAFLHRGIIANPNCSTIQAVAVLKPLDIAYQIKRIVYATYQAVSGAGQEGIHDLIYTSKGLQAHKFPHPIYNNCLPHIDTFLENGYTKEEVKMIEETRKILQHPELPITATCVRVPVLNCHSEAINVEFEKKCNIEEVQKILKQSPHIIVQDDPACNLYPLACNVSGHNEVFVGRIRIDPSVPSGINLWVVADNVRKGAATNAVQILKLFIS